MQLFDEEAVFSAACTADVFAQWQAGDDSPGGQSGQLISQSLCSFIGEQLGLRLALQQDLCLGVVGQDQIGSTAQCTDCLLYTSLMFFEQLCRTQHHGGVHIVAAAVHPARDLGSKFLTGFFLNGQSRCV